MTITSIKLVSPSGGLPIITGVHDLLSGRHDGTITPWAPIIVSGSRLDIYALDKVHLCLVSMADRNRITEICHIYKYSHNKVIVTLPDLEPGAYLPAFRILQEDGSTVLKVFSVVWRVADKEYSKRMVCSGETDHVFGWNRWSVWSKQTICFTSVFTHIYL